MPHPPGNAVDLGLAIIDMKYANCWAVLLHEYRSNCTQSDCTKVWSHINFEHWPTWWNFLLKFHEGCVALIDHDWPTATTAIRAGGRQLTKKILHLLVVLHERPPRLFQKERATTSRDQQANEDCPQVVQDTLHKLKQARMIVSHWYQKSTQCPRTTCCKQRNRAHIQLASATQVSEVLPSAKATDLLWVPELTGTQDEQTTASRPKKSLGLHWSTSQMQSLTCGFDTLWAHENSKPNCTNIESTKDSR